MTTEFVFEEGQLPLIDKDPNAELDYPFNWTEWLGADSIATASAVATGAGLTVVTVTNTINVVVVWLKDGDVGKVGIVTCSIVTTGGRKEDRSIRVRVVER